METFYYDFYVAYINLMEIVKLSVEDINEDGRSDIRVWIAMKEKSLVPFFQEIFYSEFVMGLFCTKIRTGGGFDLCMG